MSGALHEDLRVFNIFESDMYSTFVQRTHVWASMATVSISCTVDSV